MCSGVSQRQAARLLFLHRKTVAKKIIFIAQVAEEKLARDNHQHPKCTIIEFDDMESFEHTKCKPLSITLAVEHKSRRILGMEVSQMPPKSNLASLALKKYGPRADHRPIGRKRLFKKIKNLICPNAIIKSDQNPHYVNDVRRFFPNAKHKPFKGKRGCIVGQGELKKVAFDPLFSLNHTCAKTRSGVNRLIRRTWCTTKKAEHLYHHLCVFAVYHNQGLKQ